MNDNIRKLIKEFLLKIGLIKSTFTGEIIIQFNLGGVSKVSKKEII